MAKRATVLGTAMVVALVSAAAMVLWSGANAAVDPMARLMGRWAGQGTVVPAAGSPENFNCVITYLPASEASGVKQNLRCKSTNYRLDTSTVLEIDGRKVRGRWEEKTYGLDGSVDGSVTNDGFDILLSGRFFKARMAVSGTGCEQSVKVSPERVDLIREVSASLRKC
jgi:hypothetical protein